jgi:3-phosphoshikimate 1-carboxyvinyltransferase
MVAAAIKGKVEINGLSMSSPQGDKAATELLRRSGANIEVKENSIIISKGDLRAFDTDISQIPDMLPALAVLAAFAKGTSVFSGGKRLRTKESDRIASTVELLTALGGKAVETEDGITVFGSGSLEGGTANGANDHRIVMAAATAATACNKNVIIKGAQAINKSYPTFFSDFSKLGGITNVI